MLIFSLSNVILTSSNKLRTYSKARYLKDEDILNVIIGKEAK